MPGLDKPEGLCPKGEAAHKAICDFLATNGLEDTGGTRAFYSPAEWRERGEQYGTKSVLVVVHDGGGLAPCCNLDYEAYDLHDALVKTLDKHGVWIEQCTCWYSAIYP